MKKIDIGKLSLSDWYALLEEKHSNPQFQHLKNELNVSKNDNLDSNELIEIGMSSFEAKLRIEARKLLVQKNNILTKLGQKLHALKLTHEKLTLQINQMIIDVYVKENTEFNAELGVAKDEIKQNEGKRADIETAKKLMERYFNSQLLKIDSQINNLLQ